MSILRPEKRDPNYIRNKSDIGLSKVDNVSSAEYASIVLDQVKRHLNRETIYQTSGRNKIALAKIACKTDGSGNLLKILSGNVFLTFAALNESEEVREAAKLEAIYTHYTNGTESDINDDSTKVEYNLFMTDNPIVLKGAQLEFRENIYETSLGVIASELYIVLSVEQFLPFVSVNLFEYSNGGEAIDPNTISDETLESYTLIKSAPCDHNRFSLVDRSESTVGFEIYDESGEPVRVKETDGTVSSDYDIPKINGVAFTGRKGILVDGRNSRQIEINAKHSGSTLSEAGLHDWEVLSYAPRTGYTYVNPENNIVGNAAYPINQSFLDKDTFTCEDEKYGYGLCRISGFDCGIDLRKDIFNYTETDIKKKLEQMYEWSKSLSNNGSDVIPVAAFRIFSDNLIGLLYHMYSNLKGEEKVDPLNVSSSYIFDYANTSDSVTIVPQKGIENLTYEIKAVSLDEGGDINVRTDVNGFARGGDTSWINISEIKTRQFEDDTCSVTFSLTQNNTNSNRFGYYVIPSSKDGYELTYRFYQDVVTSALRVKVSDLSATEYYNLESIVKKNINNSGGTIKINDISIVDSTILDELGKPTEIDQDLYYVIENHYSEGNQIMISGNLEEGFTATFATNTSSKSRSAKIYIKNKLEVTILTIDLVQGSREFEFTVSDRVTLGGEAGSTAKLEITTNKSWELEIISGGNITIDPTSGVVEPTVNGEEPTDIEFVSTITATANNPSEKIQEIAILKLFEKGNLNSKYKKIYVYQNANPVTIGFGDSTRINIPFEAENSTILRNFYCNYDWDITANIDKQDENGYWFKLEVLKSDGSVAEKNSDGKYDKDIKYDLKFTTLVTTDSEFAEKRGSINVSCSGVTKVVDVYQDKAQFDFHLSKESIDLGYSKGSRDFSDVRSNYPWKIILEHADETKKRFKAWVKNNEGTTEGANGDTINIEALEASTDDTQKTYLGKIIIKPIGHDEVVGEIIINQEKLGSFITLSPSTDAAWYANGKSKQGSVVSVPITFAPTTATITASYKIDSGSLIKVEEDNIKDGLVDGEKVIELPELNYNSSGSSLRTITLTVQTKSGNKVISTQECKLYQDGYKNGIKVGTTTYYGPENEFSETGNNYLPIIGDEKTFTTIYKPSKESTWFSKIEVPDWLDISEGKTESSEDYLLKIRTTKLLNDSGSDKNDYIVLTSGSGNDVTKVSIPVKQYNGTWTFGDNTNSDFSTIYTSSNPYAISLQNSFGSQTTNPLNISTNYAYNGKNYKYEDIKVEFVDGSDWCGYSKENGDWIVDNIIDARLTFTAISGNTGNNPRVAKIKVTQINTEKSFYVTVTQPASNKITFKGGVEGHRYIFTNSSSLAGRSVSSSSISTGKPTIIDGQGMNGTVLLNMGNITYITLTGSTIGYETINKTGSINGKYLYVYRLVESGDKYLFEVAQDSLFSSQARFLVSTNTSMVDVQWFGTNKITYSGTFTNGYEYVLSDASSSGNWSLGEDFDQSLNTCYLRIEDGTIDDYFLVDSMVGLTYLESGKKEPSYSTTKMKVYLWGRDAELAGTWTKFGEVEWNPASTELIIK